MESSELGDTSPESERLAAETFTAASLDAVKAYARGQELTRSGRPREALTALEEAVRLDPAFAAAYVQIASIFTNLKMEDRAKANYEQALKHLDRMTEREKYRMLGVSAGRAGYDQFLSLRTTADPPDPLVLDARRRLAGQ